MFRLNSIILIYPNMQAAEAEVTLRSSVFNYVRMFVMIKKKHPDAKCFLVYNSNPNSCKTFRSVERNFIFKKILLSNKVRRHDSFTPFTVQIKLSYE